MTTQSHMYFGGVSSITATHNCELEQTMRDILAPPVRGFVLCETVTDWVVKIVPPARERGKHERPARCSFRAPLGGSLANQQKGKTMNEKKIIETLEMIVQDMADDAKNFDGKPFTGRTVAEYFGNQGAAIAALANIVKSLVESRPTLRAVDPPSALVGGGNYENSAGN
jgi:hypothetical protein